MELEVTYEAKVTDNKNLANHIWRQKAIVSVPLSMMMIALALFLLFISPAEFFNWAAYISMGFALCILLVVLVLRVQLNRILTKPVRQLKDRRVVLHISDTEIRKKSALGENSIPWERISKAEETKHILALWCDRQVTFFIPAHVMSEELRSMIQSKVSKYIQS